MSPDSTMLAVLFEERFALAAAVKCHEEGLVAKHRSNIFNPLSNLVCDSSKDEDSLIRFIVCDNAHAVVAKVRYAIAVD